MTRKTYQKSDEIRLKLLDTAEQLFAEKGYFGTSVRDITEAAGVRSASVNYHFESKENLFVDVVRRRVEPLAGARLESLGEVDIDPDNPRETARKIVTAFVEPMVRFAASGDAGWRNYCILTAQVAVQRIWDDHPAGKAYDDMALRFIGALERTFPDADPHRIHGSFQFMLGTTMYAVCDNKRIDHLSGGKYRSDDLARLLAPLLSYITGGIQETVNGA